MTSEIKTTTQNIGMLRQWINEDRIINNSEKTLISNEDIIHWLKWELPQQELKELTALASKAGVVIREAEIRDSQPKEGEKCMHGAEYGDCDQSINGVCDFWSLNPTEKLVERVASSKETVIHTQLTPSKEDSGMITNASSEKREWVIEFLKSECAKQMDNRYKHWAIRVLDPIINQLLASNTKETVTKIIKLVDEIEASHHDTSMDEWRLYKGVRNVIRDRFLDNLDNK